MMTSEKSGVTQVISKSKLKFVQSDKTDEMVAYVTIDTTNGHIYGVRKDDAVPKKIALVSKRIAKGIDIQPKVLYDVEMIPMGKGENNKSCKGFIIINLTPTLFEATIATSTDCVVSATFGNKTIMYDPSSPKTSRSDLNEVLQMLEDRVDVRDKELVIQEFKSQAAIAITQYEKSLPDLLKALESKYEAA